MTTKTIRHLILFALFVGLFSCGDSKTSGNQVVTQAPFAPYKILRTEPYETNGKAQIKCYAYLTTDTITTDKLSATLTKIYDGVKNYSDFKSHSSPTVVAVYLFTSADKATDMPEAWIAMLSKTPSENEPRITFDDFEVKAMVGATDNQKDKDEIKYEQISEYLKQRNTDLCFIYKTLYDLEGQTIKQADIKYPDFGKEHSEYQSKLYEEEKKKLFKKYNINDSVSTTITVFGMTYCK